MKLQLRVQGGICDSLYSQKAKAGIHEGLLEVPHERDGETRTFSTQLEF